MNYTDPGIHLTPWGRKFFAIVMAVAIGVLLGWTLAHAAPPALPFSPYGTVTVEKLSVPDGTIITAKCRDITVRTTKTQTWSGESWYFNLDIPGDNDETTAIDGCVAGDIVNFWIGEELAAQQTEWISGASDRINLSDAKSNSVTLLSLQAVADSLPVGGLLLAVVAVAAAIAYRRS
jgi:hypothetical protein